VFYGTKCIVEIFKCAVKGKEGISKYREEKGGIHRAGKATKKGG